MAEQFKEATILGIDKSEDMVHHANQHWARDNLSFETHSIETYQPHCLFDFILSFWCLHWTDIELAFPNMYHALKDGGRIYAVFSSFSGNSIFETWHELTKQNRYRDLLDHYITSNDTSNTYFYSALNILNQLPFKQVKLNVKSIRVLLPDIDYFKNLLLSMPFAKRHDTAITEDLIADMIISFQEMCQRKYDGKLYYETRPIYLEALK